MANLSIRKGEQRAETMPAAWDPMRALEPFRMLDPFRMIQGLMGPDVFGGLVQPGGGTFAPDIEVKETKDGYMLTADLPGVAEQDLEVSVTGNRLMVGGKREEEERKEGDRFFAYERTYGAFSRSFVLPEGADMSGIKAELKDGVLCIKIPKRAEVQPKRIQIGQGQKEKAAPPAMQQVQEKKAA